LLVIRLSHASLLALVASVAGVCVSSSIVLFLLG
jgi:hypothetical protein